MRMVIYIPLSHVPNGLRNSTGFDKGLKFHRSESFTLIQLAGYSEVGKREQEKEEEKERRWKKKKEEKAGRSRRGRERRGRFFVVFIFLSVNFQI